MIVFEKVAIGPSTTSPYHPASPIMTGIRCGGVQLEGGGILTAVSRIQEILGSSGE